MLVEQLKKAVYAISRRRYTKNQAIRKKNRLNEESAALLTDDGTPQQVEEVETSEEIVM